MGPPGPASNPSAATATTLARCWFGLVPVRSPLLGESRLISLPRGTKMFQFPRFPPTTYGFSGGCRGMTRGALPHSGIPGSQPADGSPRLFAAYHALRRLLAPRHPPCALRCATPAPSRARHTPDLAQCPTDYAVVKVPDRRPARSPGRFVSPSARSTASAVERALRPTNPQGGDPLGYAAKVPRDTKNRPRCPPAGSCWLVGSRLGARARSLLHPGCVPRSAWRVGTGICPAPDHSTRSPAGLSSGLVHLLEGPRRGWSRGDSNS